MGTSIGACDGYACTYFNAIAWKTDTSPLPIEINPRVTFERMFGETGSTEQRLARLSYKRSILDSLSDRVSELERELALLEAQEQAEVRGVEDVAPANPDDVLREQRDG